MNNKNLCSYLTFPFPICIFSTMRKDNFGLETFTFLKNFRYSGIMTILCTNISDRVGSSGGPMMNLPSVQLQGA